jgi:hypothetical protein
MCPRCLERAERVTEGIEDDSYECPSCGEGFGIDWSHGQPDRPCWPTTAREIEEARLTQACLKGERSED